MCSSDLSVEAAELPPLALAFPLLHGNVAAVMLSVTTLAHLDEAVAAVGELAPAPARFDAIVRALGA